MTKGDNSDYFGLNDEGKDDVSIGTLVVSCSKQADNSSGDTPLSGLIYTSEDGKEQIQRGHLQFLALRFISEHCDKEPSQFIDADVLRDAMSKESGVVIDSRQLGRVLKGLGIVRMRYRRKYQRYYAYLGLAFKPESPYAPETSVSTNGDVHNLSVAVHNQKSDPEGKHNGNMYDLSTVVHSPEIETRMDQIRLSIEEEIEKRRCVVCNGELSTTNSSNWCIDCWELFFK